LSLSALAARLAHVAHPGDHRDAHGRVQVDVHRRQPLLRPRSVAEEFGRRLAEFLEYQYMAVPVT
jgi:hypothetical protein